MALSGHVVGLLKEYMRDLVEQAKQETAAHTSFGFSATPYRSDQALSDSVDWDEGAAPATMSFARSPTIFGEFVTGAQSKGAANP